MTGRRAADDSRRKGVEERYVLDDRFKNLWIALKASRMKGMDCEIEGDKTTSKSDAQATAIGGPIVHNHYYTSRFQRMSAGSEVSGQKPRRGSEKKERKRQAVP
jgi:hypothetical protein